MALPVHRRRLGLLTTHPIQYQVPWFRALAREPEIELTVLYCMLPDAREQGDGFGITFHWDIPLLDGYEHHLLRNVSRRPSLTTFGGCDTPDIGRILRERAFAALVVNGWVVKSCLQALWSCRRLGIPCIVRGESNALRPRHIWIRGLHRLLLRQYAAALTIGEANRRFYLNNGMAAEKLFDAPYCVDNDRFAGDASRLRPRRAELRRSWGIPEAACVFLFCGKLIPKKRPGDVLLALDRLLSSGTSRDMVHLLVVGDGPLRAEAQGLALARHLPVSFAGFLNQGEIAGAYVAADCLVLPSDDGETWGLVVNEAMACGLPVVVSDRVGCHPDLVLEGETGHVYPLGDVAALAKRMYGLARSAELRRRLAAGATARVVAYSIARAVEGTRQALRYVCGSFKS